MKLSSLYVFGGMLPVPGTQRREMQFHAADGWQMDRTDDGRVTMEKLEAVDGGEVHRRFVLQGVPMAYVVHVEPVAVPKAPEPAPEPRPVTILPPSPARRRKGA